MGLVGGAVLYNIILSSLLYSLFLILSHSLSHTLSAPSEISLDEIMENFENIFDGE